MSKLYDDWNNKRIFKIETDRFKKKKYIYTTPLKTICQGFNNHNLYPFIVSDLYSKLYRMRGYNVMYPVVVNNLNDDSMSYSRLRGESFNSLYDYYIRELQDMEVGFDSEKQIAYSQNSFIKFVQRLFKYMYDDGYIVLKKLECYTDFSGHTIYPRYKIERQNEKYVDKESKEMVYSKTLDVFTINLSKIPNIINDINDMNIPSYLKNEMLDIIDVDQGIRINLMPSDKDISITVDLKNPEYMGGITFVALNPSKMDIMQYVTEDEYESVCEYIKDSNINHDVFTGLILKNPLSYQDIYVFASYKYEDAVHVGIPDIDALDHMFASGVGIDSDSIIDNGVLKNSDFLNGLTPEDAKKSIIEAFTSEGMATEILYAKRRELIISSFDDLGIIIPCVSNYMDEISVLDEKFYPVYYSNRFKPIITNEEKLDSNLTLKRMTFNESFILGINSIYDKVYDMYGGNDEFISTESVYDSFDDSIGFLSEQTSVYEILFNLIIRKYLDSVGKEYQEFKSIHLIPININQTLLGEQQRLGVSFVNEILNKYSASAYRMYLLGEKLNNELSITLANVEKYENLIDEIKKAYEEPFEDYDYDNMYVSDFLHEENKLLDSYEVSKFTRNLISFFESFVVPHKITKKEAFKFLILLSLVAPNVAEEINKNVFKAKYSIYFEEMPK